MTLKSHKNYYMNFYTMEKYCEAIKEYIEIYDAKYKLNNSDFDAINEMKRLIQNTESDEKIYFLKISDFVGKLTRKINNGAYEYPFLNWIGNGEEDTFSKNNFDEMMIKVCAI